MKTHFWISLVFAVALFLGPQSARAEFRGSSSAPLAGQTVDRDASATNVPTSYTTNAELLSSISNKGHIYICNTASTAISVATSSVANCVGATDTLLVSASSCTPMIMGMLLSTRLCAKSLGSAISSGHVYVNLW